MPAGKGLPFPTDSAVTSPVLGQAKLIKYMCVEDFISVLAYFLDNQIQPVYLWLPGVGVLNVYMYFQGFCRSNLLLHWSTVLY